MIQTYQDISSPVISVNIEDVLNNCRSTLTKVYSEININEIRNDIISCIISLLSIIFLQNQIIENQSFDGVTQSFDGAYLFDFLSEEIFNQNYQKNINTITIESSNNYLIYQEINRIEKAYIEDGWDGANGQAVSAEAISDAKAFVDNLPENVLNPIVRLASDGEINFLWKLSNFKLDLGVYGDGSYSYYGKTPFGEEFMGDDKLINETLSEEILAFIS